MEELFLRTIEALQPQPQQASGVPDNLSTPLLLAFPCLAGLSSEPKAYLLILRGAARLAEGGKGESEDIYGAEAVEILPRSLW